MTLPSDLQASRAQSKSGLMSWLQCPKRYWLEGQDLDVPIENAPRLKAGLAVGAVARTVYRQTGGAAVAFEHPVGDDELLVRVDIARTDGADWHLIEVKDAGSVKPHHLIDVAIQAAAADRAGRPPSKVVIAHLDTSWTYPGGEDYAGLFKEVDVTRQIAQARSSVDVWLERAQATRLQPETPERATGAHCQDPHPCAYHARCRAAEPLIDRPIEWLPGRLLKAAIALRDAGARSMDELPDDTLSAHQRRVKASTVAGGAVFDQQGAADDLTTAIFPLQFLDFETANPAVPIWAGARPYAQTPFQFSLHKLTASGGLDHIEFLYTDGADDPSRAFAQALIAAVDPSGSVVVYNAGFERARMRELAFRYPDLAAQLDDIIDRLFDLQPIAKARFYHPSQQGSWSIKAVLPALVPELRYDRLEGVQDGGAAILAYLEMIAPECDPEIRGRRALELRRYCRLDTLAMVGIWARFMGDDNLLKQVVRASGADLAADA